MKTISKVSIGVLFCGLFLGLAAFGVSFKIETKPAPILASTCPVTGPVQVNFNFSTLVGNPNPRWMTGTQILNTNWRTITNSNGTSIIDPFFTPDIRGFVCRSDSQKIECYGNNDTLNQRVHGTITIEGATFDSVKTIADSKQTNSWGAIGMDAGNSDGSADSIIITSPTTAEFKMYYNEPGDSFVVYFGGSCQPPVCSTNADCGTNGFTGSLSCQNNDVYQNYRIYTCANPGTASASCSQTNNLQLKQLCAAAQACDIGGCFPEAW